MNKLILIGVIAATLMGCHVRAVHNVDYYGSGIAIYDGPSHRPHYRRPHYRRPHRKHYCNKWPCAKYNRY